MIADRVLTSDLATELLTELETALDPEIAAAGVECPARPLDVAAKELLANH